MPRTSRKVHTSSTFALRWGEQRYEVAGADEHDYQQVDAATWI
jgi:hypothetical protein